MTFKKKLISLGITGVFVFVVLVASLVAIFANNNMLVKTNVYLTYSGSITDASISVNKWKEGETTKTTLLASTSASGITEEVVNSVTEELTENVTYFVLEYIVKNSSLSDYYAQFTYTDADSDDSNIWFRWYASNASQSPTSLMQQTLEEVDLYWKGGTTNIINNLTVLAGNKNSSGTSIYSKSTYVYLICGVKDLSNNAKFTGSVNWNLSVLPYAAAAEQIGVFKEGNYYYTYLGEMPQSYVGTSIGSYRVLEEVYTENGTDYEVHQNILTNIKYVKRGEAYYKIERIKWRVLGTYSSSSQNSSGYCYAYSASNYTSKLSKELVLIPTKILFKSQWNESLTRVNYPDSTIQAKTLDFCNNILRDYSSIISKDNGYFYYNDVVTTTQTSLTDSSSKYMSKHPSSWVFTTVQVNGWFNTAVKKQAYSTAWANGSTADQLDSWWLRTNQYNVENEVEIFKANSVGADGVLVGADITETKGVRPAIVVNLP